LTIVFALIFAVAFEFATDRFGAKMSKLLRYCML